MHSVSAIVLSRLLLCITTSFDVMDGFTDIRIVFVAMLLLPLYRFSSHNDKCREPVPILPWLLNRI